MSRSTTIVLVTLGLALAATTPALAGSAEAPELTDPAGDCAFAPGNEYMDVVAAWISDETATDFQVNLALAKWNPHLGQSAGFAVQFKHQGIEWGIIAYFDAGQGGWWYQTGNVADGASWADTTGTFADGTPAVITVAFPKDIFPHEGMDHELKEFYAGSIDLKTMYPFFLPYIVGVESPVFPPPIPCDDATSDATYTFEQGQHSMAGMDMGDDEAAGNASAGGHEPAVAPPAEDDAPAEGAKPVPAAGLGAAAVAAAVAAGCGRRR